MTNALQRVPKSLLSDLTNYSTQLKERAAAVYDLLDRAAVPVRAEVIQRQLKLGPDEYASVRRALLRCPSAEVLVTFEGLILRKYANASHRLWNLAWCTGLFEMSGGQLILNVDMLDKAPDAVLRVIAGGGLKDPNRVRELQTRARQAAGLLVRLLNMYKQIDRALALAALPEVKGKDWKSTLGEIKKLLKHLPQKS